MGVSGSVSLIEVDSKSGQGGGIYIAINDDSDPNGNYLKEYRSDEAGDFILLRKSREDLTDMAISPADYGLYGFEKSVGGIIRYDPNDTTFRHSGSTGNDEVGSIGEVAIGVDGYIHCIFYESDRDRLENFTYNEETNEFTARDMKDQSYKVDELVMSPRDNLVTWDNELEKDGTIEQNAYTSYHQVGDGYVTVCESPDGKENPEWAMPGITDLAILRDGTIIAVDINSHIQDYDGKVVLMGWSPDPHTIAQGNGQMEMLASVELGEGVTDPNLAYHLAVDEDETIHVFGEGMLRAFRINPNEQTFDAVESFAIGAGTEIAASVYKNPPLPPLGTVYDLYGDFTLSDNEMSNGNWKYMDPLGVLLVNSDGEAHTFTNLCDSDAWYYNSAGGPPGPWGFDNYWFLPWLNREACHGGRPGEVLFYGPLKIQWTAPEAGDNVEISGHLWQINYDQMNTGGTQLTYAIYLNDVELASGGVIGNEDGTLENRENTVRFDDGDEDSKIIIPHLDVDDTVSLLLEGYNQDPNAYGYASFQIIVPKCNYGLIGDLDKNCVVDIADLEIMANNWLTDGEPDYFDDSAVSINDFAMLAGEWLTDCRETDCVPFIESLDSEDGFIRSDGDTEAISIRIGDDGEGRTFNSILSFDTGVLKEVPITRAWIRLTVKNRDIWEENESPDPDKLNLTLDLCAAFNNDTSLESPMDFSATADVMDCAVEDDWGLTEAAVDEQVLIELNAAAIAAINRSGRTQFRINTGFSDDVEPYGYSQADAIDCYDGGEGIDKSPTLIVE